MIVNLNTTLHNIQRSDCEMGQSTGQRSSESAESVELGRSDFDGSGGRWSRSRWGTVGGTDDLGGQHKAILLGGVANLVKQSHFPEGFRWIQKRGGVGTHFKLYPLIRCGAR